MIALLAIVAVLQYRSTMEVTEATDARIGSDLQSLMMDWHYDLYRELSAICVALQVGPDSGAHDNWQDYLQRYRVWSRSTNYESSPGSASPGTNFVQNVYIWETSRTRNARLLRLNAEANAIDASNIPEGMRPLLARLQERSSNVAAALRAWELGTPALHRDERPLSPTTGSPRSDPITGWQFDSGVPAIVHPIIHQRNVNDQVVHTIAGGRVDWIVIPLDLPTLTTHTLPDLTRRYFETRQGPEYKVTIAEGGDLRRVVYSSQPIQSKGQTIADASMNIFGPPPESGADHSWQVFTTGNSLKSAEWHSFSGPVWFHTIEYSARQDPWVLMLQHRNGPLEATVNEVRRRNIMISGIVLLLLSVDMGLIVIASRRAHRLAELQLNFVASVSHELLTPLAAIYCTGQNAMDGLVQTKSELTEHGSIITDQARQLIDMVKQILLFASTERGTDRHSLRPLEVREILQCVRKSVTVLVEGAGFTVQEEIPPGLPPVLGDLSALSHCLQNLIVNAVKYSGLSRWIGIFASLHEMKNGSREVWISVQDRGVGIDSPDLPHIFDEFYRTSKTMDAQIHGTGLGLAVAKRIAEAMGGRLSVSSKVGVGSTFTLHLQVAAPRDTNAAEPTALSRDLIEVQK